MSNLFLVRSPFQLINAIEAANYFKSDKNILIIIYTDIAANNTQIKKVLKLFKWDDIIYLNKKNSQSKYFEYASLLLRIKKSSFKKIIPTKDLKESIHNYKVNIMQKLLISKYIDSTCLIPYAKDLIFADSKSTISEIKQLLINENVGTIPIIENNKCIGIIKRKTLWEWDYKNFGKNRIKCNNNILYGIIYDTPLCYCSQFLLDYA